MPNFLRAPSGTQIALIKAAVFLACLVPAVQLALGWQNDTLGANPIETITRASGEWTLRLLLITLAVSPLRRYTGLHWLLRLRRMLGLFAFAYAAAHFTTYVWLDQFFDWQAIARDILDRPFITVGFAAFVLLIPLAATSSNAAIRRLGGRRWQSLHRSIYAIAILAVVHFWWLVKADLLKPFIYALILAALLGLRAWWREQERRRQLSVPPPAKHLERPVIRIVQK
ncbi:sulfite oxidase heme-binding subunit YedZ [Thauera sp. Sel9]|uniref:sulfite oxidase heme-binding subunit YedZ n=1 Tax=Thauera sp. Sel9 TaxID=2974299 RepID=UPI0021E155A4|nr:protein-methionine-sulfoxide reductase heme-binding subunit MsrQ [Thauera sp. Sel9]MCV2219243.1 sulfoxide reductase heme-binding subunit YedZ [Thauera sp. Sel9]